MLEKAKNRKIFYFLVLTVLAISLFISPVFATTIPFENSNFENVSSYAWIPVSGPNQVTSTYSTTNPYQGSVCWAGTKTITTGTTTQHLFGVKSNHTRGYTANEPITIYYRVSITNGNVYTARIDVGYALNSYHHHTFTPITDGAWHFVEITESQDLGDWPVVFYMSFIRNSGTCLIDAAFDAVSPGDYVPIEAVLSANKISGNIPLEVTFTDDSFGFSETYPYATYELNFDDGYTASGEWQYPGENWFHTFYNEGIYNVTYNVTPYGGETYTDMVQIEVNSSLSNYYVEVHGLNTAAIEGANVSIWYDGEYKDSEGSLSNGRAYFTIPSYRFVNGSVTKPGYQTAYFDTYIYPNNNWELVTLYADNETSGTGDSYGNYIVTFKNAATGDAVGYSNVKVYSDAGYSSLFYNEYSNSGGVWTGLIPMDVTYYYTYPETIGYYSQSWSYNLTSSPAYKIVNLVPKTFATSTPTSLPTVTRTYATVRPTYTYNDSNISDLNVKERMTNLLVLAGLENSASADLVFAMIIVLGCTALMGWTTLSGSGAGIGAIIGFVFSLGLGLLPLWLLIAAVFLGGIYLALKLFGGTGE